MKPKLRFIALGLAFILFVSCASRQERAQKKALGAAYERLQKATDSVQSDQIMALTTGRTYRLNPRASDTEINRISKRWTTLAVTQFQAAKVTVSRDSAMLTSDMIFQGARVFVAGGASAEKRSVAERNLRRFIATEISHAIPRPEGLRVGESSFLAALHSLCPVWPFCQ